MSKNKCYYCGLAMRNPKEMPKKDFLEKYKIVLGSPNSKKYIGYCLKTKEHLIKKEHGGKGGDNIVYAHKYCNSSRNDRTPEEHKQYIKELLDNGKHPLLFLLQ